MGTRDLLNRIKEINCKLLVVIIYSADSDGKELLKEKIYLINNQIDHQKPFFSGNGFFEVDYEIYMEILKIVSSFIVLYFELIKIQSKYTSSFVAIR